MTFILLSEGLYNSTVVDDFKGRILIVFIVCFSVLLSCIPKIREPKLSPIKMVMQSPMVRIGLAKGTKFEVFTDDTLILFTPSGKIYTGKGGTYRFKILKTDTLPMEYWVVVATTVRKDSALQVIRELHSLNIPAKVFRWGKVYNLPKDTIDTREYAVLAGPFADRREIPRKEVLRNRGVLIRRLGSPYGLIEVSSQEGVVQLKTRTPLRVLPNPDNPKPFTVLNFSPGVGVNQNTEVTRTYKGILELVPSGSGDLYLVLETPVEVYLRGVLPDEMGPYFPMEALKAQAVIARTYLYYNWRKGSSFWKPYDIAGDYSAQAFSGETNRNDRTDSAVVLTRGEVVMFRGRIAETLFHACSGGHTEDIRNVFLRDKPYLRGVLCGPDDLKRLSPGPVKIRDWIYSPPPAYCSPEVSGSSLSKKKFRWTDRVKTEEIRKQVKKYKGIDIGKIVKLEVMKRGVSGQALRVKITGTNSNVLLDGPYEIRRILKQSGLKSALFVVEYNRGPGGLPVEIIFKGGGHGHGVGLCQLGSAGMANLGINYKDILQHYYPGTQLTDLY